MAKIQKLDPINQKVQAKYRLDGLTYVSNDTNIMPRDEAGNIKMIEGVDDNPLLIIEPVAERIATNSLLRVLDTRFQYYKFPVEVRTGNSLNLDIDLTLNTDPVYARYKPSEIRPILIGNIYSGILMDEVVEGVSQQNTNAYYISKELKNSGADLRFRIKIQHYYDGLGGPSGTAYFSIISSGPDRPTNREYLGPFANYTQGNPIENDISRQANIVRIGISGYVSSALDVIENLPPSNFKTERQNWFNQLKAYLPSTVPADSNGFRFNAELIGAWKSDNTQVTGLNELYDTIDNLVDTYRNLVSQSNSYEAEFGSISQFETQDLYIDVIIRNSEFAIGDSFGIGAQCGQNGHSINSEQSYWVITDASKDVDLWNQQVVNPSILTNIPTEQIPTARINRGNQ